MSIASVRTILPLAVITCTGLLAMDLYLPAVPAMQRGLGLTVAQGQATIAVFLAGLAASQLLWGEALHRFGPRACVRLGLWTLIVASFGCAIAPELWSLLAMRLLQGIAAGAATVVSPTVIRATLPDKDGVRGIAAISMIEAVIPAAGPVLGTALLLVTDWRVTFAVIGVVSLVSMPFALAATPARLPQHDESAPSGYGTLLRNTRYLKLALSHALCFAALLCFVGSGPQVLQAVMGRGDGAFATAQVCGVAAFIVMASQSGRISARLGAVRAVRLGAWLHLLLCATFWWAWSHASLGFGWVLAFWIAFCGTLGIRGPAAFSEALRVPMAQMGRASAAMVLMLLVASAMATQGVAPYLQQAGLSAVVATMLGLSVASLVLALRVPAEAG
ncbi:MFS transporter [Piscinibacter sp. HJYY11]|uniref:MFS transporter n=1 Tax=Piscinibacter sp. HJYY11 TaxID=2801333 RepID=UPI00191DC123|nr:MFS transporter [Piscinibacter sp. HJYY11]MBL0726519.1 MFS transporter [Piscinibacter sp. HJYY11]